MENLLSRRPIFLPDGRLQAYEMAFGDGAKKYLVPEKAWIEVVVADSKE